MPTWHYYSAIMSNDSLKLQLFSCKRTHYQQGEFNKNVTVITALNDAHHHCPVLCTEFESLKTDDFLLSLHYFQKCFLILWLLAYSPCTQPTVCRGQDWIAASQSRFIDLVFLWILSLFLKTKSSFWLWVIIICFLEILEWSPSMSA